MILYIIRHAAANDSSDTGLDRDRELSEKGKERFSKLCHLLHSDLNSIETIFSSPYIRAKQTAEILQKIIKLENELIIDKNIAPGIQIEKLLNSILNYKCDNCAIVGHEPDMSKLFNFLTGNININFRKGGIAKLSFLGNIRENSAYLEYFISPSIIK